MTNEIVNFDELAQKSFAPGATSDDYEKMFAAAFSLAGWHFISDGKFPNVAPYCAVFPGNFEDKPMVAAFTDTTRLRRRMAESKYAFGSSNDPIILSESSADANFSEDEAMFSLAPEKFLEYVEMLLAYGVQGIFFNSDKNSHGFFINLAQLRPIREHLENKNLLTKNEARANETNADENKKGNASSGAANGEKAIAGGIDFDELSRRANAPNAPTDALNKLFGAAFALENWEFIARGELPNINPYVAARADVAGGQQMIRAFTDSNRLQRFAKENNLTDASGATQILSIPTEGIVEYLEQFITYGVHGVWFNSDTTSDGFFIPIKQLRPVKEHLAKLNASKSATIKTFLVKAQDGLMLPSGFVSPATYTCNFYARLPLDFFDGEKLKENRLEKLYEKVYGKTWRNGNEDGSRYVVINSSSKILGSEDLRTINFSGLKTTEENQFWFYAADETGNLESLTAEEFQAKVDAEIQSADTETARKRQDNLANFGMSETLDGGFDLNLSINKVGAVNFDATIAPFYEAIVPLLKDFQGSDEFVTLLRFEPGGKSDEVENIAENSHGAYLQIRRFLYLNPKNGVRIGVNSIHSNYLRRVQTNAELIVSIELCKNLDNQTAVLYHAFQGPKTDVLNLMAAIQPVLKNSGYEPVQ